MGGGMVGRERGRGGGGTDGDGIRIPVMNTHCKQQ
jgi:hypothetical protein